MSAKRQEDDDEKPVFDSGRAGVGHNQGPALENEDPETPPDIDNAPTVHSRSRGPALSDADRALLKEWEKSGQLEKVKKPLSGFAYHDELAKGGGLHKGADKIWRGEAGRISRRGYRRVETEQKSWLKEGRRDVIRRTAARVLRGPYATIFELYYFSGFKVEELAAQFGKSVKRIYKILEKCRQRVDRAMRSEPAPPRFERPIRYTQIREQLDSTGGYYIDFMVNLADDHWHMTDMKLPEPKREPIDTRTWDEKYGPRRKPRLSEFFSAPGCKPKKGTGSGTKS
jgi:hypothetical protein